MTEDREHRERREERENEEGGTKRIKVTDKRRVRTDARPEERRLDPRDLAPAILAGGKVLPELPAVPRGQSVFEIHRKALANRSARNAHERCLAAIRPGQIFAISRLRMRRALKR